MCASGKTKSPDGAIKPNMKIENGTFLELTTVGTHTHSQALHYLHSKKVRINKVATLLGCFVAVANVASVATPQSRQHQLKVQRVVAYARVSG